MLVAASVSADTIRVATWHGDFSRKGPGLLLRDLLGEKPVPGIASILEARPDILLLTNVDFDAGDAALSALQDRLAKGGLVLEHSFARLPNTGMPTGVDIDGDGRKGGPRDAQGFGYFSGQGGQAIISRFPLALLQDQSAVLWRDVPGSLIDKNDPLGAEQRLSSSAHWAVSVAIEGRSMTLLTVAATPPVFDGPEDRNGRRNHDEVLFWVHQLDKADAFDAAPVILLGNLNLDPERGDGLRQAVSRVLTHKRLQDALPGRPTVKWDSVGEMRVSYVLPDKALRILDSQIMPPEPKAGPHRLVWLDLAFP